jgi:hypothetical protein
MGEKRNTSSVVVGNVEGKLWVANLDLDGRITLKCSVNI